ncbi:MAG: hypothetical protein ACE5Q6_11635 [Dehalococcoidia bacterium]
MANLHPPVPPEQELIPTKGERRFGAVAHATALLVGVPLFLLMPSLASLAFVPCPVISYMIARSFRRHQLAWGAFQALQASVMQLLLLVLAFIFQLSTPVPGLANLLFMFSVLVFIYTLWGAWDTLFGMSFRYLFIGPYIERVSQVNLARPERRRRWFGRLEEQSRDNPDRNNPNQ